MMYQVTLSCERLLVSHCQLEMNAQYCLWFEKFGLQLFPPMAPPVCGQGRSTALAEAGVVRLANFGDSCALAEAGVVRRYYVWDQT